MFNIINIIKKIIFQILKIIFACVVVFWILELSIRIISPQIVGPMQFVYDSQLYSIPVANQKGRVIRPHLFDYIYTNNSYGFRGSKEYAEKQKGDFRILFVGDSFTYGVGVNDEQTFCYLIENELSTSERKIEVINAGNGGKGTDYALKFFQTRGYKFKPDMVVLCFFFNDFLDNEYSLYYGFDDNGKIYQKPIPGSVWQRKKFLQYFPIYNWLISWSHVANLFKKVIVKFIIESETLTNNHSHKILVYYPRSEYGYSNLYNKKLTAKFIAYLKKEVENAGSQFVVFYMAAPHEVKLYRDNHEFSDDERALNNILKAQNVMFLSLTPVLADSQLAINKLFYLDGHWTVVAHSLASRVMSAYIKNIWRRKSH